MAAEDKQDALERNPALSLFRLKRLNDKKITSPRIIILGRRDVVSGVNHRL